MWDRSGPIRRGTYSAHERNASASIGLARKANAPIEKRDTRERTVLHSGEAVAETTRTTHRGYTTDEPVELIVFYAGEVGLPLSINEHTTSLLTYRDLADDI
jgi:hypothetical protein